MSMTRLFPDPPRADPAGRTATAHPGPRPAIPAAALLLGVLGDALLRSTPWALNIALWSAALVVALAVLGRGERRPAAGPYLALALAFAALPVWRDSPTLRLMALGSAAILLGLGMAAARGGPAATTNLTRFAVGLLRSVRDAALGAVPTLERDIPWRAFAAHRAGGTVPALLRGAALALPIVVVCGTLLVAADARFEAMVGRLLSFDVEVAVGHLLFAGAIAWTAAGVLRTIAVGGRRPAEPEPEPPHPPSIGIVEAGVVLGLLDLLFLAFVLVQVPYFFGSAGELRQAGSATFAEYARRGFFELVTLAALVLPILLLAGWAVRRESRAAVRAFRALAATTLVLLAVIMASGMHRMRLYVEAYGLTELRLYTTAFMLWLAVVLILAGWHLLRDGTDRLTRGLMLSGLGSVLLLHAIDPDALIVRTNASRPRFDARHAATLSADAVPAVVAALVAQQDRDRCPAVLHVLRRWSEPGDWRSWSVARRRAVVAVSAHRPQLEAMACGTPRTLRAARSSPR
jgi:hypothetical protein